MHVCVFVCVCDCSCVSTLSTSSVLLGVRLHVKNKQTRTNKREMDTGRNADFLSVYSAISSFYNTFSLHLVFVCSNDGIEKSSCNHPPPCVYLSW